MGKNGDNKNVIELWGHDFKRVRDGLDEGQVVSFVNELNGERDLLVRRVEHLSSLTKLAEKTVLEADRLAEEIKRESVEQAKVETNAIMAKAEEQAQQIIEEKRTEIITIATEEAKAIKTKTEREAGLLLESERKRIQPELMDIAQRLYRELLSQLEGLKQQVIALEVGFEHKLSQPAEQASTVTVEKELPSAQVQANIQQESNITLSAGSEVSLERAEDIFAESQQPTQTVDQISTSEVEEKAPLSADSQDRPTYEDEVELEILSPIDVRQIMGIMRHLDSLAEVENTELVPLTDRPLIIVFLREPIPLIEILRALPEVDEVEEITAVADATHAESKRRKLQITLSGNSVLDDAKERLNSEVSHSLSS